MMGGVGGTDNGLGTTAIVGMAQHGHTLKHLLEEQRRSLAQGTFNSSQPQ